MTDNVLTIKTIQVGPFKTLITCLKEILEETNITFQADGMRIVTMDKTENILIHTHLEASKFQTYDCKKEKIIIAVNMQQLYSLVDSINPDDILTIYIKNEHYSYGIVDFLCLTFENGTTNQCINFVLKLIDPDTNEVVCPIIPYSAIILLPSSDFQKNIRILSGKGADKVEITSIGDELRFKISGLYLDTAEIIRTEKNDSMEFKQKQSSSKIIQGVFSLKTLMYFTKCTSLCQQIELYLENNKPLIVKYNVASLGVIKLCLSSVQDE